MGAGEIEEDTMKELAEAKRQLETIKSALQQAEAENQQLRARLVPSNSAGQDE